MVRGKKPLRSEVPESVSSRVDCKHGAYLHLPVGHVVRAVLDAPEDPVELWWQNMCICRAWVRAGSCREVRGRTLNTEELPDFQRRTTHPRELGYEARQICLSHHERGRGLGGVGGCRRTAEEFRSCAISEGCRKTWKPKYEPQ